MVGTKKGAAKGKNTKRLTKEEAAKKAKELTQQLVDEYDKETEENNAKEGENTPTQNSIEDRKRKGKSKQRQEPRAKLKPAWIQYYEDETQKPESAYGKGFAQTYDYFETDLMGNYINSCDRFFDTINKNPEACALLYQDERGNMRILHHLTVGVDGSAIVVGVEGLGSMSRVKSINIETFSEKVDIGAIDADGRVPPLSDLVEKTTETFKNRNFFEEGTKLGEFLEQCAVGYMLHPIWMSLLHDGEGKPPQAMAETLLRNLKIAFDEGVKHLHEYESIGDYHYEIYHLLVYLWASHHNKFSVDHRNITTTNDSLAFNDLQNSIIRKVLLATKDMPDKGQTVPEEEERGTNKQKRKEKKNRNQIRFQVEDPVSTDSDPSSTDSSGSEVDEHQRGRREDSSSESDDDYEEEVVGKRSQKRKKKDHRKYKEHHYRRKKRDYADDDYFTRNRRSSSSLCAIIDDTLRPILITNALVLRFLRSTCLDFGGKPKFGFSPAEIGNKSIRSGAAMALFMARHTPDRIMLMGRWKSLSFLDYLRPQVLEWTRTMSNDMIRFDYFFDINTTPKSTLQPLRYTDNGRAVKIHNMNVNFDRISK